MHVIFSYSIVKIASYSLLYGQYKMEREQIWRNLTIPQRQLAFSIKVGLPGTKERRTSEMWTLVPWTVGLETSMLQAHHSLVTLTHGNWDKWVWRGATFPQLSPHHFSTLVCKYYRPLTVHPVLSLGCSNIQQFHHAVTQNHHFWAMLPNLTYRGDLEESRSSMRKGIWKRGYKKIKLLKFKDSLLSISMLESNF